MKNLTLKEEFIERWKKGQGISEIQQAMKVTINLFDKSLRKLNDAILKGRFEILGMNGERPSDLFKINTEEKSIAILQDKLSRRNMQIKELKKQIEQLEINTIYKGQI